MSARATDVAGDLELGSARRERAGQAHDEHLLAGAGLAHVEEDGRVELEAVLRAWRGLYSVPLCVLVSRLSGAGRA